MDTSQLPHLEVSIDQLLNKIDRLKFENQTLRHKIAQSARERSRLIEQKKLAANQVKLIINQLRETVS